jgi:hypothetical protein
MKTSDDDSFAMGSVNEIGGENPDGFTPPGLAAVTQFVNDLRSFGAVSPPEPSADLAAMLSREVPPTAVRAGRVAHRRRHRGHSRPVLIAGSVAATLIVLTGVGAARHDLPAPAQRMVSTVVNRLTPFHIDQEPKGHPAPIVPLLPPRSKERSGSSPSPRPRNSPSPSHRGVGGAPSHRSVGGAPSASPVGRDDGGTAPTGRSDDGTARAGGGGSDDRSDDDRGTAPTRTQSSPTPSPSSSHHERDDGGEHESDD